MVEFFYQDNYLNNLDIFSVWANWDGGHFIGIAENGYLEEKQFAFFPLFPLLIRITTVITGNYFFSGLLLSNLFAFLAVLVFYKLLRLDFDRDSGLRGIYYLIIFPTAFFLGAVYTESLLLFLSVFSFFLIRQKKYFQSSITALLASAADPLGIILTPALIVEYLSERKFRLSSLKTEIFLFLLPIFGILSYMLFSLHDSRRPFFIF